MKKRIAAFLLVLCLAGTACFAAAEQAGITGPVQWKGYELAVDSVRTGSGKELDDLSMRGSKYMEENSPISPISRKRCWRSACWAGRTA